MVGGLKKHRLLLVVFKQSRETQITVVKWTNAGGQTKQANERSFVYRPPAWRRWRNVKTTYSGRSLPFPLFRAFTPPPLPTLFAPATQATMKRPPLFTLKIPVNVNIVRIRMCMGHWSLNVLNPVGTIHTRFVLYMINRSPRREITWKRAFFGATIVEQ